MGGWSLNKKRTVEESRSISTSFLKCQGYLRGGFKSGGMNWIDGHGQEIGSIGFSISLEESRGEIRFEYTVEKNESLHYRVQLASTSCHFGGKRWWFLCPILKDVIACQRRVGKLYLAGGKYFGCRRCYDLTYESCQQHDSRVDEFVKEPVRLLHAMRSPETSLVTLKAFMKFEKQERSK